MKSGWVILDKDSGLFSRTAGGRIARMLGTKKYGHIGTHCPPPAPDCAPKPTPQQTKVNKNCVSDEISKPQLSLF